MFKYLKKYWIFCCLAPLFMIGEIAMDLIQPRFMATIVDDGILSQNMDVIVNTGIKMVILVVFGGTCGIICGIFANIASKKVGNDIRKDLFKKTMNLSIEQTDKISTGSLVTRITNDVTQIESIILMSVRSFIRCSLIFLGGIFMLYLLWYKFAVITTIALPFIIIIVVVLMKKLAPLFLLIQTKLDKINNIMQENIKGARVIKAYIKEDYECNKFKKANDDLCFTNLKAQYLLAFMNPAVNIILNLCIVAVIYIGGMNVQNNGTVTTGEIMAAITYLSLILTRIIFMANIFQTYTRAQASWERIKEVLSSDIVVNDGNVEPNKNITGEIEFKNVSFAYPDAPDQNVLHDISFKISKGETIAIIGSTGSGKSTIAKLLPRFYDINAGKIYIDNIDIKDYKLNDLRNKISIVLQKSELYSRTIEENIKFGRSDASEWDIKKAGEIAQADEFICNSNNGYFTQVTESGHSLSGGQKQRIAIARALIRNSEILIFDDSSSALDLKTESEFFKELNKNFKDTTKIIIAQRIATVKNADKIIVLDNGKVENIGNHDELLKASPIYQEIFNSQIGSEVTV